MIWIQIHNTGEKGRRKSRMGGGEEKESTGGWAGWRGEKKGRRREGEGKKKGARYLVGYKRSRKL
jgi:hypothetical protein